MKNKNEFVIHDEINYEAVKREKQIIPLAAGLRSVELRSSLLSNFLVTMREVTEGLGGLTDIFTFFVLHFELQRIYSE